MMSNSKSIDLSIRYCQMSEFVNRIFIGDCSQLAATLPSECVQTIVTSPPYWHLRKYSETENSEEVGRENTVEEYIEHLVGCINAVRHLLSPQGALWLNLGDTYCQKALMGVPWRIALALIESGWILRNDIIWHKPNAMPSSVKDRMTVDHEYIFFFTKEKEYYFDADSIREEHVTFSKNSKMLGGRKHFKELVTPERGKNKGNSNLHTGDWTHAFNPKGRNKRTVWNVPLSKFRGAHYAVFPEKLIEPCILSTSRPNDVILDPFMGAGTTALTALRLGRKYIGFEIVEEYQKMAIARIDEFKAHFQPDLGVL